MPDHRRPLARIATATAATAVMALVAATPLVLGTGPAHAVVVCTQDWRPAVTAAYLTPAGEPTSPPRNLAPPPSPEHRPRHLFCGGRYVTTAWIGPVNTTVEATRLARDVVAHAVYPTVQPRVNPARGLTGLASWFWAEADAGPVRMLRGNGPDLDLELQVSTVRWRFGDGTPGWVGGLGAPYPTPSPVRHVFERKGRYTVDAEVVVAGRLWFQELITDVPSGTHVVALRHDVAEVRSLLHAR